MNRKGKYKIEHDSSCSVFNYLISSSQHHQVLKWVGALDVRVPQESPIISSSFAKSDLKASCTPPGWLGGARRGELAFRGQFAENSNCVHALWCVPLNTTRCCIGCAPNAQSNNIYVYTESEFASARTERWGAGVETQKYVRGEIGGWGRVPFNETYAPSLSTIYDGA